MHWRSVLMRTFAGTIGRSSRCKPLILCCNTVQNNPRSLARRIVAYQLRHSERSSLGRRRYPNVSCVEEEAVKSPKSQAYAIGQGAQWLRRPPFLLRTQRLMYLSARTGRSCAERQA